MVKRLQSAKVTAFKPSWPFAPAIIGSVFMGASPIFVRIADIGPNAIGFYRMLLSLPLLWVWMHFEQKINPQSIMPFSKKDFTIAAFAGFFLAGDLGIWHFSLNLTTVVNATLFNYCTPFFVPLIMWFFFSTKPTLVFVCTLVMAIIGSIILTGESVSLSMDHLWGDILALLSAIFFSGYIVMIKQLRLKFNAPTLLFWTGISTAFFLGLFSFSLGEDYIPDTHNDWIAIVGLVVMVHLGGQGLLSYAMGEISASLISIVMMIAPIVAAITAWILFSETMDWHHMVGAAIILISIVIARKSERKMDKKIEKRYGP